MKKLIVGLGNPGLKYRYNRHNVGFIVVDSLVLALGSKLKSSTKFDAKVCVQGDLVFALPQSFMNASGSGVSKVLKYYDVLPENLFVIHDDLDLPFLKVKKQFDGGSAGHHGIEDAVEKLGTAKFWRVRVGIGRPENTKMDSSDWVLSNFSKEELGGLQKIAPEIKELIGF